MKTIELEKIESYLPVFPGFYGTILEVHDHVDEEQIEEEVDYNEYYHRIAEVSVPIIAEWLEPLNIEVEFQKLVQPRYYNYGNDQVNVEFTLAEDSWTKIIEYLEDNEEDFREYIKSRYTSYDGFSSFYSNDSSVWLTSYIPDKKELRHVLGTVLEFYLDMEDWTEDALYEVLDSQGEFYVKDKTIKNK